MRLSTNSLDEFTYSLWLSPYQTLDKDIAVQLNVDVDPGVANNFPITTSVPSIDLSGSGTNGVWIPSDIPHFLCGKIYLIALIDSNNQVAESNEANTRFTEALLECSQGIDVNHMLS